MLQFKGKYYDKALCSLEIKAGNLLGWHVVFVRAVAEY